MAKKKRLALFSVETATEKFWLLVDDDDIGDMPRQLAKALGLKMKDPLPKPLNAVRVDGRVAGRV